MRLHLTLLFPHGTYGWDPTTLHKDRKRRVRHREFYVYHLNKRDTKYDYLLLGGRLPGVDLHGVGHCGKSEAQLPVHEPGR